MDNKNFISLSDAEDALGHIDSDERDTWVRIGKALHDEFGDAAFSAWDRWSQSSDSYSAKAAKTVWKSIGRMSSGGRPVTIATVIYEAKRGGWNPAKSEPPSPEVIKQHQQERERRRIEAERMEAERADAAAAIAADIWSRATPAADDHPYLVSKQVPALGLRWLPEVELTFIDDEAGEIKPYTVKNALIVPAFTSAKKLSSLQMISPDGKKRFLLDGRMAGAYAKIGEISKSTKKIAIVEGWATGASVHLADGLPVIVAFNAGNLPAVAEKIAALLPTVEIIIGADNDQFTKRRDGTPYNPGLLAAREVAETLPVRVVYPEFASLEGEPTDFNDLHTREGLDAVRAVFDPPVTAPQSDQKQVIFISKKMPLDTARQFRVVGFDGHLHYWNGEFFRWNGTHYSTLHADGVRSALYAWLEMAVENETGSAISPNQRMVNEVCDALRGVSYADISDAPSWLVHSDIPARNIIPCRNGFLNIKTRQLSPADPKLFCTGSLDFDYVPKPPPATEWMKFLNQLWPDDQESIDTLAEIIGYLLTDDTDQQKAFMLIGPKRSGKGTILRVLQSIVGNKNTSSPTFSSLGTQFGIQPLIGKRVAIISDARLSHKTDQTAIAENILRITGEDSLSIPRKFMEDWQGKLPTRFVVATNEIPSFSDASAALASRFIILKFTQSFYGFEDFTLTDRLLDELPSIMHWALDGLERLRARGRFVQPVSGRDMVDELESSTSPIGTFVEDECEISEGASVLVSELYARWKTWCDSEGRLHPGTAQSFGRALQAFCPTVSVSKPRINGVQKRTYDGVKLKTHGAPW